MYHYMKCESMDEKEKNKAAIDIQKMFPRSGWEFLRFILQNAVKNYVRQSKNSTFFAKALYFSFCLPRIRLPWKATGKQCSYIPSFRQVTWSNRLRNTVIQRSPLINFCCESYSYRVREESLVLLFWKVRAWYPRWGNKSYWTGDNFVKKQLVVHLYLGRKKALVCGWLVSGWKMA